jgi:hypothetical protein
MALLLAVITLMTACTPPPAPPSEDTAPSTETPTTEAGTEGAETPTREIYEDLSHSVPERTGADGKSATVTVNGELTAPDVVLNFDGESGLFAISSTLGVEIHDAATCESCGFTEEGDYLLSNHYIGGGQAGFTLTLATPIPIASVTGMTVTYATSGEAVNSVFRVMTHYCTTMATFHNECPSLAGASEDYRTVDLNITDMDMLSDDEGNLSAFQFYFRNKDNIDARVKSITVCVDPSELMTVTEIEGNYFSRGDVTKAIAETVAARFEAAGVGAEITVAVDRYRQNNSKMDGGIQYEATATLKDGTVVKGNGIVTIPHVEGVWLDDTAGSFGSSHDNLGQWQQTFDPAGMVLLSGNAISAKEGILTAEYAVIPESADFDSPDAVWRTPHVLEMDSTGISLLFVNAWLDHADILTEGQRYRLLVRGVTSYENYVLHLDIPFTYKPLETDVTAKLSAALETVNKADFTCPADTPDKAVYIAEQLTALLGDSSLRLSVRLLGEGVNSATVQVSLLSEAAVTHSRLPAYALKGQPLTGLYAFEGDALTSAVLNFPYETFTGSIELLSPFDGEPDVHTASPEIHALWTAPMKEIESGKYPFVRGENCLPIPVELTWRDENPAGKTYTVTVSVNRDLSEGVQLTATSCKASIKDLQVGQTYYWQVTDGTETSQLFTFTTADDYPRFFELEGVSNFRDVGGYMTKDGKRVKRGVMYRSAYLNEASAEAKDYMVNTLGIRMELDLRGSGAPTFGKEVSRRVIAMQWYTHIFKEENYGVVRATISEFAKAENYPLNFHCAVGRDRTGTTSFLILGLLGVDEDTLRREYYASLFSDAGSGDITEAQPIIGNINSLRDGLIRFDADGTLQQQIEAYLLTVGVTAEEIASIREILLED